MTRHQKNFVCACLLVKTIQCEYYYVMNKNVKFCTVSDPTFINCLSTVSRIFQACKVKFLYSTYLKLQLNDSNKILEYDPYFIPNRPIDPVYMTNVSFDP